MATVSRGADRAQTGVRAIHVVPHVLGHCHSSACAEVGATRVVCAVRPPQQLVQEYRGGRRGRVSCVVHRPTASLHEDASRERALALALEGVAEQIVHLDAIPQLLVEVVIEVMADDGAVWDAASTAMAAALAAGGLEMGDLFSACSAGLLADGAVVVDLSAAEEREARAAVTLCACLTTGNIVFLSHRGACELATVNQLVDAALIGLRSRKAHLLQQIRATA